LQPALLSSRSWKRFWKQKSAPNGDGKKGKIAGSVDKSVWVIGTAVTADAAMPTRLRAMAIPIGVFQLVGDI
jgi:hypothetical protein